MLLSTVPGAFQARCKHTGSGDARIIKDHASC